jgi:hypothetical protein
MPSKSAETEPKSRQEILDSASALLTKIFDEALGDQHSGAAVDGAPSTISEATERLFATSTASWRDMLVGVALLRAVDPSIDIHLPRKDQGSVVTGRTITEQIVTPFMLKHRVPFLKNPYLSVGRGDIRFETGGESRKYRDPEAFVALVEVVTYLRAPDSDAARRFLRYLLRRFIILRESVQIDLIGIPRLSLDQYLVLTSELLGVQSGGRSPALVSVALLQTVSARFGLHWSIEWQGINVADKASGAVGDITVKLGDEIVLGLEVTERPVDETRVAATFEDKIAPNKVHDYLFILTREPSPEARAQARKYFAMGFDVNFFNIRKWLIYVLGTLGPEGRAFFQKKMIALLSEADVPANLKVAWNASMGKAVAA